MATLHSRVTIDAHTYTDIVTDDLKQALEVCFATIVNLVDNTR